MKTYVKQIVVSLSFTACILFLLFSFLYLTKNLNKKQAVQNQASQTQIIPKPTPGMPVRLIIPAIQVDAGIQNLGVTDQGEMEVPSTIIDVGWFKPGSRPGDIGSAVISGHFNGTSGEPGVFAQLETLKKGDELHVKDDRGTSLTFIVRESRIFDPGYADEVFGKNDTAHLNLVTCDGYWDPNKKSYSKRLVVFSDLKQ